MGGSAGRAQVYRSPAAWRARVCRAPLSYPQPPFPLERRPFVREVGESWAVPGGLGALFCSPKGQLILFFKDIPKPDSSQKGRTVRESGRALENCAVSAPYRKVQRTCRSGPFIRKRRHLRGLCALVSLTLWILLHSTHVGLLLKFYGKYCRLKLHTCFACLLRVRIIDCRESTNVKYSHLLFCCNSPIRELTWEPGEKNVSLFIFFYLFSFKE